MAHEELEIIFYKYNKQGTTHMIKLFTEEKYKTTKRLELLSFKCERCGKTFSKSKLYYQRIKNKIGKLSFCSKSCGRGNPPQSVKCKQCGKEFLKPHSKIKSSSNHFCSQSCSTTHQNAHKTTGYRRSKLEIYLEEQLGLLYIFEIKYNSKTEINSELDIYIPNLRLAFELNGIFHYEPIYVEDKLSKIQNNDSRKFQACIENNISLCIIDSSTQKQFTTKSSKKYLDIICNIINIEIAKHRAATGENLTPTY